jgi:dipeptidyl aminopeptidase/acylaminoacyl peptidase
VKAMHPASIALRRLVFPLACVATTLSSGSPANAASPYPYNAQSQVMLRRLSDATPSPDGKLIAFTLRTTDYFANRGRTDIYVVGADGKGQRQLTSHLENDGDPQFSPDGAFVYFLSPRNDGKSILFRVPTAGGTQEIAYEAPIDIESFHVAQDGKTLIFAAEVYPDCTTLDCTVKRNETKAKSKATGVVYDKLLVRHWDTWKAGKRSHLFAATLGGGNAIAVDLMKGMDVDSPVKPHPSATDFTISPDSKTVVFAAREGGKSEAWSTNVDLYAVAIDGKSAPKNITQRNLATDTTPIFSPDGKSLVYLAMTRPKYEADRYRVMLRTFPDGPERELAPAWDRSPHGVRFSRDGKSVYATADDVGQRRIFVIDTASGSVRALALAGEGAFDNPFDIDGGRIVAAHESLRSPADLYSMKTDGADVQQVTRVNPEMAALSFGDYEQFSFKGARSDTVYAYLVKPVGFDASKKYPVAFLIHGGPQGSMSNRWSYRWNPQVYAGHGYATIMVDFHGSTGYGQGFTDAIRGDWGGKPLEDLKKGLDAAIAKYAFLDGNRVAALGASYGGFMINWIAGNWSERFRCLVNHDGNFDEKFAYYATEELWFPEWEHGGTPWENPASFAKHNPSDHVNKWKTPMLVIHGGKDYRVVETEGIATFTALQRRGIPSKMLYFPDENHWVLKPQNSVLWHDTVLGWLERWTGATGATVK